MISTSTPNPMLGSTLMQPTIWGLDPTQLHDRFWAARGVQVVRQGEPSEIVADAELFLLTDPRSLVIFRLGPLVDKLSWIKPDLLLLRMHERVERGYREIVVTDAHDRFRNFERIYGASDSRLLRIALTPERDLARMWQSATDPHSGWRQLRYAVGRDGRFTVSIRGSAYDRRADHEVVQFTRELVQLWKQPDATISRARRVAPGAWGDRDLSVDPEVTFVGQVWVGAGRQLEEAPTVVGPAVLWDDPAARPVVDDLRWQEIEPTDVLIRRVRPRGLSSLQRGFKRAADVLMALVGLVVTLPFYPLVMLAIWLEDGRPFFFAHRRETLGGKLFPCLKFRSMRKDAEQIKEQLAQANQSDGPQFFMEEDPRLTHVGRFLRKFNIDELPQFFNVLLGHMSMVGPRPSPFTENQFCPGWREARLSVRPGITGLWQIKRSRVRGLDFQEWIRYDLEYVESVSWKLDLWIIGQTFIVIARRLLGS